MRKPRTAALLLGAVGLAAACSREKTSVTPGAPGGPGTTSSSGLVLAPDIRDRLSKLPRTPIDYDRALLDPKETQVVQKLIEASRYMNDIFLVQVSQSNPDVLQRVSQAAAGDPAARWARALFDVHKGPWDRLKENEPFIGKEPKPPGAGFYPPDMKKEGKRS